jgi:hypothetical protein
MSKFMYMLCMKFMKMQAHEVYEIYNKTPFAISLLPTVKYKNPCMIAY